MGRIERIANGLGNIVAVRRMAKNAERALRTQESDLPRLSFWHSRQGQSTRWGIVSTPPRAIGRTVDTDGTDCPRKRGKRSLLGYLPAPSDRRRFVGTSL